MRKYLPESYPERRKVVRVPVFSRGLGLTLLSWFLLLALVPVTVVSLISYYNARNSLSEATEKSLFAVGESKARFVNNWFNYRLLDLEAESSELHNSQFFERLSGAFQKSGEDLKDFISSSQYKHLTAAFGDDLKNFRHLYKYHDVIMIDNDGNVLYTIAEENDLGTNILTGIYSDTVFSKMCRVVLTNGGPVYSDLSNYEPSGKISGFLGQVMFNEKGNQIGMMAFQINPDVIDANIQDRTGMGETGEAYLVGVDLMMRSISLLEEEPTALRVKVDTEMTRLWRREHAGNLTENHSEIVLHYTGRKGRQVIGMHHSIEIAGVPMAVIVEVESSEAFAASNRLGLIVISLLIVTSLIVLLIAITVSRVLVRPLLKLSDWAQQIAIGNLATESINAPSNEIGNIADSFAVLVKSFQDIIAQAYNMSEGNYDIEIDVRSEQDEMGYALQKMARTLQGITEISRSVAGGDYSQSIEIKGGHDQLGKAINEMVMNLNSLTAEQKRQLWLSRGRAEINEVLSGELTIDKLAEIACTAIAENTDSQMAVLYVHNIDTNVLELAGGYAIPSGHNIKQIVQPGCGIIGQAFKKGVYLSIDDIPDDSHRVNSALCQVLPKSVIAMPIKHNDNTLGVMEIASLKDFDSTIIEYLINVSEAIAIAIISAKSHKEIVSLLDQSQKLSESLQAQQQELRTTNEVLESQTHRLRASEENLKKQQKELQDANEQLEEKTELIEKRSKEITSKNRDLEIVQRDLQRKARDLELTSKYKSEFLANMSHELRTPLNSLLILSKELVNNAHNNLSDSEVEAASIIHSCGNDLLMLINEILDLSKVESGKMIVNSAKVNISEVVQSIEISFKRTMDEKGLDLNIITSEDLPQTIQTDSQRLQQIIKNLMSNAIKFTEKGGITVDFHRPSDEIDLSKSGLDHGGAIGISVTDTGLGIADDKLHTIFEAFQQADGSTSRKYGGTGLGLSISKEMASLLGGEIHLSSAENEGSTFTVYIAENLIVDQANIDTETQGTEDVEIYSKETHHKTDETDAAIAGNADDLVPLEKTSAGSEAQKMLTGKNVLLVDDDMRNVFAISRVLQERGMIVLKAANGQKALDTLAGHQQIDIVLMDIMMPVMDGYEAIEKIRQQPEYQNMPIIALTAKAMQEDRDKCIQAGANDYLTKPIDIENLLSLMHDCLFKCKAASISN